MNFLSGVEGWVGSPIRFPVVPRSHKHQRCEDNADVSRLAWNTASLQNGSRERMAGVSGKKPSQDCGTQCDTTVFPVPSKTCVNSAGSSAAPVCATELGDNHPKTSSKNAYMPQEARVRPSSYPPRPPWLAGDLESSVSMPTGNSVYQRGCWTLGVGCCSESQACWWVTAP